MRRMRCVFRAFVASLLQRSGFSCESGSVPSLVLLLRIWFFCCESGSFVAILVLLLRIWFFCCESGSFVASLVLLLRFWFFCCESGSFLANLVQGTARALLPGFCCESGSGFRVWSEGERCVVSG